MDDNTIPTEDIANFLREARQGDGLTTEVMAEWLSRYNEAPIDREFAEQAIAMFETATTLISNRNYRRAIRNALGFDGQGANLTERRMNYLTNEDISLRTLIRHEDFGADATAELAEAVSEGAISVDESDPTQVVELLLGVNKRLDSFARQQRALEVKLDLALEIIFRVATKSRVDNDTLRDAVTAALGRNLD